MSRPGLRVKPAMTAVLLAMAGTAFAQSTPVGLWHNIDDKTGEARAAVRIGEAGGVLSGRIEKLLRKDKADAVCSECTDDRKDKPVVGMEIIRGARASDTEPGAWTGGKILDPDNGREYTLRLVPLEGGKRLQVRGYLGPFYRTQTWVRVQ